MTKRRTAILFAASSLAIAGSAYGQQTNFGFFPNDTTFSSQIPPGYNHNRINSVIIFGYTKFNEDHTGYEGPTSPTMTIATGAGIDGGFLECDNETTIIMDGTADKPAGIYCPINFQDSSTLTLSDNNILACGIAALDNTTVNINGGTVGGDPLDQIGGVVASSHANVTITGGTVYGAVAEDFANLSITGGAIKGDVNTASSNGVTVSNVSIDGGCSASSNSGTAVLTVSNCNVKGGVGAGLNGNVDIQNCTIKGAVSAGGTGQAEFEQGSCGSIGAFGSGGAVFMDGGTCNGDAVSSQTALFGMNGGTVTGSVHAYDTSYVHIAGGIIQGTLSADGSNPYIANVGVILSSGTVASAASTSNGLFTMNGGTVTGDFNASNFSYVQLNNGTISGTLQTHDNANVTVAGATVGNLVNNDSGNVYLTSGTVTGDATAHGGYLDIQNGHVAGNLITDQFGFAEIDGGQIDQNVQLHDSSGVYFEGGAVTGKVITNNSAFAELIAGTIAGGAQINDGSSFNIFGGSLGSSLTAHGTSTTFMNAGSIAGSASFFDASTFVWTGGTITGGVFMHGNSTLVLDADTIANSGITLSDSSNLALNQGSGIVLRTSNLHINPGGKLDIADNKAIVPGGDVGHWNGAKYTGIAGQVQAGRNNGTWDGSGIVTSMPRANGQAALNTIAVATAGDVGITTFGGVSVAPTDVLVDYTFAGDADLTGSIDGDDYARIDQGFASESGPNPQISYANGDFNYDGKINADDYFIIDNDYAEQFTNFDEGDDAPPLGAVTAVPEPTAAALISLTSALLLRRRRNRKSA